MKRLQNPFQRLQWRLTLSYTLVTVVTLFVLETIVIVWTNQASYNTSQYWVMLTIALQDSGPQIAQAFQTPDRDARLQAWVDHSVVGNTIMLNNMSAPDPGGMSFVTVTSSETFLAVVDAHGQILASNHSKQAPAGARLADSLSPRAGALMQTALSSANRYQRLWYREGDQVVSAVPVVDESGRLLGAALIKVVMPSQFGLILIALMSVLPTTLLTGIGAGLIGTFFGALTARGLTRRLKRISQATLAWGQGNFSTHIQDRSKDEIGRLGGDLNHMADDLRTLVQTRQDLATAEERNRLARDLHDSVKQQVFAARMNLGAAQTLWERDPVGARAQLEAAVDQVSQSQRELNGLIQTLRPVLLDEMGLTNALRGMAEDWSRQSGIPVRCRLEGETSLPREVEEALYRIAQEGLANAARHSQATSIEIELTHQPGAVCLQISDDGRGFDPSIPARGMGLRSMRERAEALGGDFRLESASSGTHLSVTIPIEANEHG
jgi:two-component system, NarL family, sensor histidine kinase LiaS